MARFSEWLTHIGARLGSVGRRVWPALGSIALLAVVISAGYYYYEWRAANFAARLEADKAAEKAPILDTTELRRALREVYRDTPPLNDTDELRRVLNKSPESTRPETQTPRLPPLVLSMSNPIQLGIFSSEAGAASAWRALTSQFSSLAQLAPMASPVTVEGRTVYRLRATGLRAEDVCRRLRDAGKACAVVPQSGACSDGPRRGCRQGM